MKKIVNVQCSVNCSCMSFLLQCREDNKEKDQEDTPAACCLCISLESIITDMLWLSCCVLSWLFTLVGLKER